MFEIIFGVLIVVLAYILGFKRGYEFREREAIEKLDRMMTHVIKEEQESTIRVKIEKVNDVFYVYNEDDSSFMAQGKNKAEIGKILNSRFPNKKFAAEPTNMREVGFPDE